MSFNDDWRKLAEPIPPTPEASTAQKAFPWVMGIVIGLLLPRLLYTWQWRPVWAYLFILALAVVAGYFVTGRIGSWRLLALLVVGGVLLMRLIG
jgi:hypothetical protein